MIPALAEPFELPWLVIFTVADQFSSAPCSR
ncbi:Uncharacterised protein [Mycobacteroides abscessus]|nr:Uncharacterised protein [Mycobacteroides abscessus]